MLAMFATLYFLDRSGLERPNIEGDILVGLGKKVLCC